MKRTRIFIKKEPSPLIRLIVDLTLRDLTDEEKRRVQNGEVIRIPADELFARKYGTASFK